jgi:putative tryptophan/tyrosine transport system substrate-binding protein
MKRRAFITLVGGAAAAWPVAARAQQPERGRVIGLLMGFAENDPAAQSLITTFRRELARLGWIEGSSLRIEIRWGNGSEARIGAFAKELVNLRPDIILGQTTAAVSALAQETSTIPIVFTFVTDPIGSGFAATFAHPGGNITGFTSNDPVVGGKWMGLLKEIAPRTVHVAVLYSSGTAPQNRFFMPSIQTAASSLAVQVSPTAVHAPDAIEGVIAAQARNPGGSLLVMPDPFNRTNRDKIIALSARYGVPAIYDDRPYAESGGLMTYGADRSEQLRQAAEYVDRILKGAKPMDLPVQNPTKFELIINLKTAKALNIAVPQSLLGRADDVIE